MTGIKYLPHLLAAIVLFAAGHFVGSLSGDLRATQAKLELVTAQRDYQDAAAYAEREARQKEQAHAKAMADIAATYETEKKDAQDAAAAVIRDLRAGNVRLRAHWQACQGTAELSRAVASAAGTAGSDGLFETSVERILRDVGTLQAQRDALIDVTQADRETVNGTVPSEE